MDIQVAAWHELGSSHPWLDQREQEHISLHLAGTQGAPAILLPPFGLPDNQGLLCWGCMSSSMFKKHFTT